MKLLLNDIFNKLQQLRIAQLMQLISKHNFGQIFLANAPLKRSKKILGELDSEQRFFEQTKGVFDLVIILSFALSGIRTKLAALPPGCAEGDESLRSFGSGLFLATCIFAEKMTAT